MRLFWWRLRERRVSLRRWWRTGRRYCMVEGREGRLPECIGSRRRMSRWMISSLLPSLCPKETPKSSPSKTPPPTAVIAKSWDKSTTQLQKPYPEAESQAKSDNKSSKRPLPKPAFEFNRSKTGPWNESPNSTRTFTKNPSPSTRATSW